MKPLLQRHRAGAANDVEEKNEALLSGKCREERLKGPRPFVEITTPFIFLLSDDESDRARQRVDRVSQYPLRRTYKTAVA